MVWMPHPDRVFNPSQIESLKAELITPAATCVETWTVVVQMLSGRCHRLQFDSEDEALDALRVGALAMAGGEPE